MGRQAFVACFVLVVWFGPKAALRAEEVIHLFVALADNASQGLVPVPAKIGNGDDPANNLYWGCDEGVKSWFSRSAKWKRVPGTKPSRPEVLERVVFKHKEKDAWLVADAWRGSEMKACMKTFAAAVAGQGGEVVSAGEKSLKAGGDATMLAFIGHNGLMDFTMTWPEATATPEKPKPVIALCCISVRFFAEPVKKLGARPLLMTTQLMYPGAFVLHDAVDSWLAGGSGAEIRAAAGRAYARNQKISVKAATGVFWTE
jgi:hypothetical protein